MTTLDEWVKAEAMLMARHTGSIEEALDIWEERTRYAIQRFMGYDGAHAALMGHPKTLTAPVAITLLAHTAEEAADLTNPATLIGVRVAIDMVLREHAQRREVTLNELMEMMT